MSQTWAAPDLDASDLVAELSVRLAGSESGVRFVYEALDRVCERFGLTDAILVADPPGLGRQVFRSGRRPLDGPWAEQIARDAALGLYLDPVSLDAASSSAVAQLCSLALRVDLLSRDASRDPLTGLLNRRAFEGLLDEACARSARYGWTFSVVVLDLDGLKTLNDTYGHAAGDTVLQATGRALQGALRAGDAAARVGGDEFAVVFANNAPAVHELLARVQTEVFDGSGRRVGFSAGIAEAPADGTDPERLFRIADERLYAQKRR